MRWLVVLAMVPTVSLAACETDSGCSDDFDCAGALVCRVSTGKCELFICDDNADCSDGKSCNDNVCE